MDKNQKEFGSRFLYAEDLLVGGEFKTVSLQIAAVHQPYTLRRADNALIDKPVIAFVGKEKMLVLCKTNVALLRYVTGEPLGDAWIGKTITLQARIVEAFGSATTAIRVMPPRGCIIRKSLVARLGSKAEWYADAPPAEKQNEHG